mmetsp:Transcript_26088/g.56976  ORF Transcript_26088/g.56976 Transcript_26088/m.56976 type:complete len:258 (-) Transcript_26088:1853-2626(-)
MQHPSMPSMLKCCSASQPCMSHYPHNSHTVPCCQSRRHNPTCSPHQQVSIVLPPGLISATYPSQLVLQYTTCSSRASQPIDAHHALHIRSTTLPMTCAAHGAVPGHMPCTTPRYPADHLPHGHTSQWSPPCCPTAACCCCSCCTSTCFSASCSLTFERLVICSNSVHSRCFLAACASESSCFPDPCDSLVPSTDTCPPDARVSISPLSLAPLPLLPAAATMRPARLCAPPPCVVATYCVPSSPDMVVRPPPPALSLL